MIVAQILRCLALVALVLMPFTMTVAPARAQAMPTMMAGEHCAEHSQPQLPPASDMAQCMLMCAALPAAEPLVIAPPVVPQAPRQLALIKIFHGIILEIATPPPRPA